jgi:hypothetical protein
MERPILRNSGYFRDGAVAAAGVTRSSLYGTCGGAYVLTPHVRPYQLQ